MDLQLERIIFGISGLPGCGKTSLGKWIEAAALELNWSVKVISLDDFYLPSNLLDDVVKGNPWNVSRGYPGTHSINEMGETINTFLKTNQVIAPQFDKSLRNGAGDRSGYIHTNAEVLILEGWFLGCLPSNKFINSKTIIYENSITKLSESEIEFRKLIQTSLFDYKQIWSKILQTWHLKSNEFSNQFNG